MTSFSANLLAATVAIWSTQGSAQAPAVSTLPQAVILDRALLERYVGTYKCELGTAKVFVGKDGRLTLQIDRLRPIPLIADGEAQFHPEGIKATLVFHADTDGISHFVINKEGKEIRADRKRSKA